VRESVPIPVVILCGGQGSRMGGAGETKKELVPVGDRAIIWHVMRIFASFGHTDFILTLGHMAAEIRRYFMELNASTRELTLALGGEDRITFHRPPQEEGWRITMVDTGLMTKKGSRIGRVSRYLGKAESFFVTYGDGVGDVDIDALLAFHRSHSRPATITGVQPRSQYGLVEADQTGQVAGFDEKPRLDHWINGGFMVFQREVLDYFHGDDVDLERDTLSALAAAGELMMYRHSGYWRSMDTFKEAVELDAVWRERSPWKTW